VANYLDIEIALVKAAEAVDSVTPMGKPGFELSDTPDGLWIQLHNVRVQTLPATLGDKGEDNNSGFLQIDFNYPKGKGTGIILQKADEFANYFTAGKALLYNAQEVKVVSTSLSSGRYVGGYYRLSLTITYYARTTRNI
jgi:hypothetical protein